MGQNVRGFRRNVIYLFLGISHALKYLFDKITVVYLCFSLNLSFY